MTSTQTSTTVRPETGTYVIDPGHSGVTFTGRHLMVSKVRGRFGVNRRHARRSPTTRTSPRSRRPSTSQSRRERRRQARRAPALGRLLRRRATTRRSRSARPRSRTAATATSRSSATSPSAASPSRSTLEGEYLGTSQSPWGDHRVGFSAETEVSRKDWGLEWNMALEAGGVLVGDKIKLTIDAEADQAVTAVGSHVKRRRVGTRASSDAPVDIDALLARMTLDEKLAQLGCVWCTHARRATTPSPCPRADALLAHGIGEITRIGATTGLRPRERAAFTERDPALPRRAHAARHPRDRARGEHRRACARATRRSSRRRSGSPRRGIPTCSNASAS